MIDEFAYDTRPFQKIACWIENYLETTKNMSSQWWDMYSDQQEFWDGLPAILKTLAERRSVVAPDRLPKLTDRSQNARFRNTISKILRFDSDHDQRQDLEDLLVAFAALTARMVQLDWQTLDEYEMDPSIDIPFASEAYLGWFIRFISYHPGSSFWATLRQTHQYDYQTTITAMAIRFVSAPQSGFDYSTSMAKQLMRASTKVPSLLCKTMLPLETVNRIMQHYSALHDEGGAHAQALLESMAHIPGEAQKVFHGIDPLYQDLISKQVTALNRTLNSDFIDKLSTLLSATSRASEQLIPSMSDSYPCITDEIYRQAGPVIVELTWKLLVWRKCLMEGRMELRVQCVDCLQGALVDIFRGFMHNSAAEYDNPIAQYVADLLLANKVVEYLVGVDSHYQLIFRSGNIVGFLVITRRYGPTETDAIWRTVTTSQDSQTVHAILGMLHNFIHLADYGTILYLTTKLNQLPLQSFDEGMVHYGIGLLSALVKQWMPRDTNSKLDMPPYQLCIRIIREAAADNSLAASRKHELNAFGTSQLRSLLRVGPSEEDRKHVFEECVHDIRTRPDSSTGSIWAVGALMCHDTEETLTHLVDHFDLTRLVVEELAYHTDKGSFSRSTIEVINEHLSPRLNILQSIVRYCPDSLDHKLGQKLWDAMLGPKARYGAVRDKAWLMLVKAINECITRNSFLDKCISLYLPQLDPACFATSYALDFVDQVIQYESRLALPTTQAEGKEPAAPSGVALLWHMASVVPSGTIELQAIHKLVSFYLDSPKAKTSPRAAMEAAYIEVVDRCVSQLCSAAASLKRFTDGTSSGEDEQMVIVASEDEIQVQRVNFSRSLLTLKEFVEGAQSRPMYSPLQKAVSQLPTASHTASGEPLHLKYQAFAGGQSEGIRSMEIGDLESVSDLSGRLSNLTSFPRFSIIAGGQEVDLKKDADQTLRDFRMGQKGLLIIKKAQNDTGPPDMPTAASKTMAMQGAIMKHFSKLHPLLGLEDDLAQQVSPLKYYDPAFDTHFYRFSIF